MRQSIYIAISLLVILLVTGCADKERQSAPDQEDYIATSTEQGMTVNDPEPSGRHPRNQLRNRKIHLLRILRIFFQKKKKSSCRIRPLQQQNRSKNSTKIQ